MYYTIFSFSTMKDPNRGMMAQFLNSDRQFLTMRPETQKPGHPSFHGLGDGLTQENFIKPKEH